ncbi:DUF2207 domain-containing protein [Microbacterium lushaniae]|uniref:DUF2207 domain-containing protein n=1 Tax=Microbacterium lushaniae TaxID=2614639 RepID=A0A5J6L6Q2_9MICO|nr:DUF2207 domain-containing protein [Microbacterium lushaniae]QEW04193.1 DUF2207 domain-containing protein [Microbacterium lushaniae]
MKWMRRTLAALVIAFTSVGAGLVAAPAASGASTAPVAAASVVRTDVNDFTFASMDADYTLTRAEDGASELRVVETFVAEFPDADQNRGMQRLLPEKYLGAPLEVDLISVTDADGEPREVETESDDGYLLVTSRADDYVHGEQTYVFTYTMRNVVRFFDDTDADEFYWNVNGLDWQQPFGRVTAALHVDEALAAELTGSQACYAGARDSTTECPIAAETAPDGAVTVRAEAMGLGPHETLTVAVGFASGTFTPFNPSFFASPWGWLQLVGVLIILAAAAWAIVIRVRLLSDAPGRPTVVAEFTPPAAVDALESAVLLGKTTKAIPAEVLEQAVVGSIRIVEGERRRFGGLQLEAHLVDPARADGDGRMLLNGLFGEDAAPGAVFTFGRQDTRLSTAARAILAEAGKELTRSGLRREVPLKPRMGPALLAFGGMAVSTVFGVLALLGSVTPLLPIVLLIVSALALVFVIGVLAHKPLTPVGADTRDHLAGLKVFIDWAEADRIRMLQSPGGAERVAVDASDPRQMLRIYESLLPYAVVFGQEKQWSERLGVLYESTGTPGWYVGASGFNAGAFASGIGSLSASATSSSSTSGGSTGGGSAGGGGGGGGGGGV